MSRLIVSNFRTHAAAQFLESVSETANSIYYVGAHRSIPFPNDNLPPDPVNTIAETHYNLYDDLIFGKNVTPADIKHMIRNVSWTSGTVYDMYDDTVSNLETRNFFVVSPESTNYHVFKCLSNFNGSPSTSQPLFSETSADDESYVTNDGYQWKYMFSIDPTTYAKFATTEYIPVVPNANVTANAVVGAINTIIITDSGSQYNSYASGTIKEAAVNGNTLTYGLSSERFSEYDVTLSSVAGFVEEKVTSLNTTNNRTSNGVIIAVFSANNTLRITNVNRGFVAGANLVGVTTSTNRTIVSATALTTPLNPNAGFYKNNLFYIRSGLGAGQLRTITEYIVTGDTRRVILNSALNTIPDTSSVFEIGPNVVISGDGINAKAIAIVNPTANTISDIEIIDSGSNYTFANITIIANTGNIAAGTSDFINTSTAKARAIIGPSGGHGSDVINELYANRIGIGMSFANTESDTIPATNDFRKLSIIKDPLFANIELTLTSSVATNFTPGEYIVQANTGATGQISSRSGTTLRLTNINGFFATGGSIINANTIISGKQYIIITSGNTNFITFGSTSNTVNTIFTANTAGSGPGTGTVLENVNIITGRTSNQFAGVVATDRSLTTFDQREIYNVEMLNTGPAGKGFERDELVLQTGLQLISSDIIKLTTNTSAFSFGDGTLITQYNGSIVTANGIIIDRGANTITVNPNFGTFLVGNSTINIIKTTGNTVVASVSNVDNTFQANGLGYIHSLNGSNTTSTVIGLTGVQGVFNLSDDPNGVINTFIGQTNGATAKLTGKVKTLNTVVDGSGEILYVETFEPVSRSTSQTEKVKIIIEF
jgi:hypothetical protein